jgi:hypothetical protein
MTLHKQFTAKAHVVRVFLLSQLEDETSESPVLHPYFTFPLSLFSFHIFPYGLQPVTMHTREMAILTVITK